MSLVGKTQDDIRNGITIQPTEMYRNHNIRNNNTPDPFLAKYVASTGWYDIYFWNAEEENIQYFAICGEKVLSFGCIPYAKNGEPHYQYLDSNIDKIPPFFGIPDGFIDYCEYTDPEDLYEDYSDIFSSLEDAEEA